MGKLVADDVEGSGVLVLTGSGDTEEHAVVLTGPEGVVGNAVVIDDRLYVEVVVVDTLAAVEKVVEIVNHSHESMRAHGFRVGRAPVVVRVRGNVSTDLPVEGVLVDRSEELFVGQVVLVVVAGEDRGQFPGLTVDAIAETDGSAVVLNVGETEEDLSALRIDQGGFAESPVFREGDSVGQTVPTFGAGVDRQVRRVDLLLEALFSNDPTKAFHRFGMGDSGGDAHLGNGEVLTREAIGFQVPVVEDDLSSEDGNPLVELLVTEVLHLRQGVILAGYQPEVSVGDPGEDRVTDGRNSWGERGGDSGGFARVFEVLRAHIVCQNQSGGKKGKQGKAENNRFLHDSFSLIPWLWLRVSFPQ
ncbi:MAG: hypothetical protein BWY86_00903 [Candidatus Aminicenantes bacterium ADurb.Bin508]|nr:MAG: hypothetical protein BWY86_00903 [Candidatus Aminicenantes bacterium ADurb.Bin508]